MKKVATGHRPLLLNWFRAGGCISGGAVEGFNNHAKLTMRRSFGLPDPKAAGSREIS
jgi:hypothetical protein